MTIPTFSDVEQAYERIKPFVKRTPILTSSSINNITNAEIFFKCENFQKTGAFKFRGAANAVLQLNNNEALKGVATHSSGNFAQALALAARNRGIPATVVMPSNSPQIKKDAVAGYGAGIVFCEPTLEARESTLAEVIAEKGSAFIHSSDDFNVIAGQGTAGIELIDEIKELDIVITPVGGGGLLSGVSIAVKGLSPGTEIIAAEPKGADDAFRSFEAGYIIPSVNPDTIADGLLTSLGELTFPIIRQNVSRIITVSDDVTIKAMRLIWERMKIVIEPSAAVAVAIILDNIELFENKRVGVVLSGGNVDLNKLPWI